MTRKPPVILASRNAEAIALRRPDAFVVDHHDMRVLHGAEQMRLSAYGCRTQAFSLATAILTAANGFVQHDTLWDDWYGDDVDGGPIDPGDVRRTVLKQLRPFLAWAGLYVHSDYGHRRFEAVWLPAPQRLLREAA